MKHLVELLCDRMYWYMQRDHQDKKVKKMQNELDRCRPGYPETSNHADVLKLQMDQTSREKQKCCDRLNGADGKLLDHLVTFVDKQGERLLSTQNHGVKSEDVDSRLETLRGSLLEQFHTRLKEESGHLGNSVRSQLQEETAELKLSLEQEKERNDRLQTKMEEMEKALLTLEQRHTSLTEETLKNNSARLQLDGKLVAVGNKLTQLSGRIDGIMRNTVTTEALSSALEQFDSILSAFDKSTVSEQWGFSKEAGMKTRRLLQTIVEDLNSVKLSLRSETPAASSQKVADLQNELNSCVNMVESHSKQHSSISETLKSIEDILKQVTLAQENDTGQRSLPGSPSKAALEVDQILDQKFQPFSASIADRVKTMMQEKLNEVARDLGTFVNNERVAREHASAAAEDSLTIASTLRQDVDVLRDGVHASMWKLDCELGEQKKQIHWCNEGLASFDRRLQRTAAEGGDSVEKLELQLRVVNAWQSNFTTASLYQDITKHITDTLPLTMLQKINSVTSRLEAIEAYFKMNNDGTPRKRKTSHK